jgi:hypothetical protein
MTSVAELFVASDYNAKETFLAQPLENILHVLVYLDIPSLIKFSSTCICAREICNYEWIYRAKLTLNWTVSNDAVVCKRRCITQYKHDWIYSYYIVNIRNKSGCCSTTDPVRSMTMKKYWTHIDSNITIEPLTYASSTLEFPMIRINVLLQHGPHKAMVLKNNRYKYIITFDST